MAGGAGNELHLIEALKLNGVNAVATANLFNFIGDGLPNARNKIIESGENIANWQDSKDKYVRRTNDQLTIIPQV